METYFPRQAKRAKKSVSNLFISLAAGQLLEKLLSREEPEADRSGWEFHIFCVAIRLGVSKDALWNFVETYGKVRERGRDYFDLTWDKALAAITTGIANAVTPAEGNRQGIELSQLISQILMLTGGWPRRVGAMLIVDDALLGICYLRNPASFFAWLNAAIGQVTWHSCPSCITKEELYHEFLRVAKSYDAIQETPHEPLLPNYYYSRVTSKSGDGQRLEGLIDSFEPATPLDRTLILAAFLTLVWGGTAGARPIFVITADGRGFGKTALTDLMALLVGGCLPFSKNQDYDVIVQRLLSPEGLKARMVLLDNLKTRNFSWAEFEALVTALVISGKQMYVGEARRPNHLTYVVTGNSVALSTDIAQRSVIIQLGKPTHSGDWFPLMRDFVAEYRAELIADIIGYLRRDSVKLSKYSRWGEWEQGVLAKLPHAEEAQRLILQRRDESDIDADIASSVEAFVEKRLSSSGYDTAKQRIRIPTETIAGWFNTVTQQNETTARASATLRQMADEGQLKHLRKSQSHKHERSFIWTGDEFTGNETVVFERKKPGSAKP